MWNVATFANGQWERVGISESIGEWPSTALAMSLAANSERIRNSRAMDYMRQEEEASTGPMQDSPARRAIENWSKQAEQQYYEFNLSARSHKLEAVENGEGLAYYASYQPTPAGSVPDSLVWHDRTLVVIPVSEDSQELTIEYVPDVRDENRVARMRAHGASEHALETVFEWRGYFGEQSVVVDGWNAMRQRGKSFLTKIRGMAGLIVGFALRRLSRPQRGIDRDPTFVSRLASMTAKYPEVVKDIPELNAIPAVQRDAVLVFVHGTLSCGIQSLKELYQRHIKLPTFRYEHDTFRPLQENGGELADLISSRIQAKRLYLVGHSRGGLVARVALEKLRKQYPLGSISLHTFGTPHLGTPLAQIGARLVNLLFKVGGDLVGAIPVVGPLARAYSYSLNLSGFPPGLDVMRENSDALALLNELGDPAGAECWGSAYDMKTGASGFAVELEGVLLGALGSVGNDLVVPASSALAFGVARPMLTCSHVQYFAQAEVQAFFDSLATAPLALSAAAGAYTAPTIVQNSQLAGYVPGENLFIGDVRSLKRQQARASF